MPTSKDSLESVTIKLHPTFKDPVAEWCQVILVLIFVFLAILGNKSCIKIDQIYLDIKDILVLGFKKQLGKGATRAALRIQVARPKM